MARPSTRPLGNLPAEATTFVGRQRELADLRQRLSSARLVSLVGPGGVGKTRLAIRAATTLRRSFHDGAWMVELAEVRDPALAGNAVMAALDLHDQAATEPLPLILSHLRDRELLLVIDNCEHLLDAVSLVISDVIAAAPRVRVIATSREPLSLPGEHVVPVTPLDLPVADAIDVRQNEAVTLFAQRAAEASGSFAVTASNQSAVAAVCRRLDGLPLAIELAAVRTRVLTAEQILDRLSDRFGLLSAGSRAALPRHQTLRTTIDWSHDLLEPDERVLLRRLCVFAGRFTIEDVESVCGGTLDQLSSLVDKSLVMKEDARGVAAYRLHETMREYAALKLREAGELDDLEERCVDHFWSKTLMAIGDARFRLDGWLAWIELEMDNVRWVLRRCVERKDFARGAEVAVAVGWFWITRATTEGVMWLDHMLGPGGGGGDRTGWAHFMRGFLALLQGDAVRARNALRRAIELAREHEQPMVLSHALSMGSVAEDMNGDGAASERLLAEAAKVTPGLDAVDATVGVLQARVFHGFFHGDVDAVRAAAAEGQRLSREASDLYSLEMMTMNRGFAELMTGDAVGSRGLFVEALRIADRIDDRIAQYALLEALGCVAINSGKARLAAQLFGASEAVRAGAGAEVIQWVAALLDDGVAAATKALGAARFGTEFAAGRELSRKAAIALALGESSDAQPVANGNRAGPLGKREADVARLVAGGLSNKQIGAQLFISERTVDSHVRSILNKLGFDSRAQIAAWVATSKT